MKILLATTHVDSVSTLLNAEKLKHLNNIDGVSIDFYNTNYAQYDVVLFMGYDVITGYDLEIEKARKANPAIKIGVVDPRPHYEKQPIGVDFILANGIEMRDWYLKYTPNIFIYYIYPELQQKVKSHHASEKITVGYHGNNVHLQAMYPRVTRALEMLADDYEVEVWAMYNIEKLGKWDYGLPDQSKVYVKHIQWSEKNYEAYMSKVDIGIIPNLIPIKDEIKKNFIPRKETKTRRSLPVFRRFFEKFQKNPRAVEIASNRYREHETDYLIRYKANSNPGRIFVFVQYGIPVIADMFPSALQIIDDGVNGFVCYSTEAWYWALKRLADNPIMRTEFAQNMMKKFDKIAAPRSLNENLVKFIKSIRDYRK